VTRPSNPRRDRDLAWLEKLKLEGRASIPEPPPPPTFSQAIAEFNRGDFFKCHETLEALWLKEGYPVRLFYQGLLKIAVGFLHLQRRNRRGSLAKLREGLETLEPFAPEYMGVKLEGLIKEVHHWLENRGGIEQDASLPKLKIV
jgi:predicted metal-dependent hydrolase